MLTLLSHEIGCNVVFEACGLMALERTENDPIGTAARVSGTGFVKVNESVSRIDDYASSPRSSHETVTVREYVVDSCASAQRVKLGPKTRHNQARRTYRLRVHVCGNILCDVYAPRCLAASSQMYDRSS